MKTTFNSRETMTSYKDLSLRKVAATLNLNYNMLLKTAKKPIEGVAYDPLAINYNALDTYVNARVDEKVLEGINWATINDEAAALHVELPKEFNLNQKVKLRQDDATYQIIFMTPTHIVLNPINDESNTQPRVLNLATFLHQGPQLVKEGE
jgi:hypothetical protein